MINLLPGRPMLVIDGVPTRYHALTVNRAFVSTVPVNTLETILARPLFYAIEAKLANGETFNEYCNMKMDCRPSGRAMYLIYTLK